MAHSIRALRRGKGPASLGHSVNGGWSSWWKIESSGVERAHAAAFDPANLHRDRPGHCCKSKVEVQEGQVTRARNDGEGLNSGPLFSAMVALSPGRLVTLSGIG